MKVPSYRKHVSGQARVTIRGKDFLLGPWGSDSSKAAYQKLLAQYLLLQAKPKRILKGDTIGTCVGLYLDHCETYYSKSNEYQNIRAALEELIDFSKESIEDFGPAMYKQIRERCMAKPGVTRTYVNRRMQKIRAWVKWCVGEEHMQATVYTAIQCIPSLKKGRTQLKETKGVTVVSDDVVEATVKQLPPVVADMVRLQRLLGCRPGEICSITPSMVDRANDVWEIHLADHKTAHRGKDRTIYVGTRAQAILAPYLKRGPDVHCFSPQEAEDQRHALAEAQRVTPANQGNRRGYTDRSRSGRRGRILSARYTSGTYARAIFYACQRAWPAPKELSPSEKKAWHASHRWSPNQLRHAAATEIRRKAGIEAAQVILGHSEITVTQIYAERDRELAIETVRKLG